MVLLELEEQVKPLTRSERSALMRYLLDLAADDNEAAFRQTVPPVSFLQAAQEFAGCIADTPPDLSTNPAYMEDYGA